MTTFAAKVVGTKFTGAPCDGTVTTFFDRETHPALDIGAPEGTPMYPPADLTVIAVQHEPRHFSVRTNSALDLGNTIFARYDDGNHGAFGHMSTMNAKAGDRILRRQIMGAIGNTGFSTGPHTHWLHGPPDNPWLNNGRTLWDPLLYLEGATTMPEISEQDLRLLWDLARRALTGSEYDSQNLTPEQLLDLARTKAAEWPSSQSFVDVAESAQVTLWKDWTPADSARFASLMAAGGVVEMLFALKDRVELREDTPDPP